MPQHVPWILLPYYINDSIRCFRIFPNQRIYKFDFPILCGRIIYTSAPGWLLLTDSSLSVPLFSPLAKDHILLPSLPDTSDMPELVRQLVTKSKPEFPLWRLPFFFEFYQFRSDTGEHIVALIYNENFLYGGRRTQIGSNTVSLIQLQSIVLHIKTGNSTNWIKPSFLDTTPIDSLAYQDGKFYLIDRHMQLSTCNLSPDAQVTRFPQLNNYSHFYHMVAVAGELLLVTDPYCHWDDEKQEIDRSDEHCDCYRLDTKGQMKWSKIQDIKQHNLFVTLLGNIIAVTLPNSSGCSRNSVYICGDFCPYPLQRFYVVNVGDGFVCRIPQFEEKCHPCQPNSCWFIPTLH